MLAIGFKLNLLKRKVNKASNTNIIDEIHRKANSMNTNSKHDLSLFMT